MSSQYELLQVMSIKHFVSDFTNKTSIYFDFLAISKYLTFNNLQAYKQNLMLFSRKFDKKITTFNTYKPKW